MELPLDESANVNERTEQHEHAGSTATAASGAIGAVMIVDYWVLRRRRLDLADLYHPHGRYAYTRGWNFGQSPPS